MNPAHAEAGKAQGDGDDAQRHHGRERHVDNELRSRPFPLLLVWLSPLLALPADDSQANPLGCPPCRVALTHSLKATDAKPHASRASTARLAACR